jgi:hypothetical protein
MSKAPHDRHWFNLRVIASPAEPGVAIQSRRSGGIQLDCLYVHIQW